MAGFDRSRYDKLRRIDPPLPDQSTNPRIPEAPRIQINTENVSPAMSQASDPINNANWWSQTTYNGSSESIPSEQLSETLQHSSPTGYWSPTQDQTLESPLLDIGALNKALQKSAYDERAYFLPVTELDKVVSRDNVLSFLTESPHDELREKASHIARYVCDTNFHQGARRIFSILAMIGRLDAIVRFQLDGIYDEHLPFVRLNEHGADYNLARKDGRRTIPLKCFEDWVMPQIFSFENYQWYLLAPVFHQSCQGEHPVHRLLNRHVLPWTQYDRRVHDGTFSEVRKMMIHPDHYNFDGLVTKGDNVFALQTLKSLDDTEFRLEVKALMKINLKPRSHLVNLLTTFYHMERYHLLFRWADGGNLYDLWQTHETSPSINRRHVLWLAEQCHGLADGLNTIHNSKLSFAEVDSIRSPTNELAPPGMPGGEQDCGRHGDIKPQNILWFRQDPNDYNMGVLKLSDFGLTTFHSAMTTKVSPSGIPVTRTYMAPEHDLNQDLSRPFDIWSLGCVYLEFITWILRGKDGLDEFNTRRCDETGEVRPKFKEDNFYLLHREHSVDPSSATVKSRVGEWIDELRGESVRSPFIAEFLTYIETHMIRVRKTERHNCSQVSFTLANMHRRCREQSSYALKPYAIRPDVPGFAAGPARPSRSGGNMSPGAEQDGQVRGTKRKREDGEIQSD